MVSVQTHMFYKVKKHWVFVSYFFFLSGFSFTNIQESQDCRGRGRALLNSSLPLPPASQTLRHNSQVITAENSPLHIASSQTRTENLWFRNTIR